VYERFFRIKDAVAVLAIDDFLATADPLLEVRAEGKVTQRTGSVDDLGNRGPQLAF
jgi:hypothetical protein